MTDEHIVELYVLKSAAARAALNQPTLNATSISVARVENSLAPFIAQFPNELRVQAEQMAEHYKLFYMLENDIRRFIDETLTDAKGVEWWDSSAPNSAKEEYKNNFSREQEADVTARSEKPLDYISFGQLGEIIRANWDVFGGMLRNQKALGRIMFMLNMLRGPIAHCGILAEDEVDRLHLSVKDWLRLLEGPQST